MYPHDASSSRHSAASAAIGAPDVNRSQVDLLHVTPALESVWQSRRRIAWRHGAIGTVSRAGLVALKRLRGSGQDHDDIKRLTGETE